MSFHFIVSFPFVRSLVLCRISCASGKMCEEREVSIRSKKTGLEKQAIYKQGAREYGEVTEINIRKGKELFLNRKFLKVFHAALSSKSGFFSESFCHTVLWCGSWWQALRISMDILADIPGLTGKSPLDQSTYKFTEISVFGLESLVRFPIL